MTVKLTQHPEAPDLNNLDKTANWIVILPEKPTTSTWKQLPYGALLKKFRSRLDKPGKDEAHALDLPNKLNSHLGFTCVSNDISSFKLLGLARKLIQSHQQFNPAEIAILVTGFSAERKEVIYEALVSAILATTADLPEYKQEKSSVKKLARLKLYGCNYQHAFSQSFAMAEGNALARRLSMLPPNHLRPTEYRKEIQKLARAHHWDYQFYGMNDLKKKKAGAFLAVCQGSPDMDAGIVRLTYQPRKQKTASLSLVGKGICYDTGGTNLKPAKYMFGMHEDMQGSAVALGTLLALSKLKVNYKIECWLALAMNHIGPKSYKPNDVVTACDGTSIEVVHTDAEGRMVLSDTLVLASRARPDMIIDYATLTGACVYSLGTAYSGVFTNQDQMLSTLIEAGRDSGERVWPFPIDDDYDEAIKSNIADVKQCALEGDADHILAARFLQRFVKYKTPWLHVDLASSNRKGGLAHIATDTTGFGIRFTLDLILNKEILKSVKKDKK